MKEGKDFSGGLLVGLTSLLLLSNENQPICQIRTVHPYSEKELLSIRRSHPRQSVLR